MLWTTLINKQPCMMHLTPLQGNRTWQPHNLACKQLWIEFLEFPNTAEVSNRTILQDHSIFAGEQASLQKVMKEMGFGKALTVHLLLKESFLCFLSNYSQQCAQLFRLGTKCFSSGFSTSRFTLPKFSKIPIFLPDFTRLAR